MKMSIAVGLRFKELLKKNNMTQYQLFLRSGVAETTISAVVRAVHEKVTINIIYDMLSGFSISLKEFFDDPLFEESLE